MITDYVNSRRLSGITSSAPAVLYGIQVGSAVRLYPTSAGSATIYSSSSPSDKVALDIAAGNAAITGSTNAKWTAWGAGTVTADTTQQGQMSQTAVAVVVTSGTWIIEVAQ